jgi:hypothetical protein
MKKTHKHTEFEVITRYCGNGKQETLSARCVKCGEDMPEVVRIFRGREEAQSRLLDDTKLVQKGETILKKYNL